MSEPQTLSIHMMIPRTRALGPGERFALWVQGCPFRCKECLAPNTQSFDTGTIVQIDEVSASILREPDLEGITISGGEPFSQPSALAKLIDSVRNVKDLGVIVYTGYLIETLWKKVLIEGDIATKELLERIDLLIDGPYIANLNDGHSLRGSSNQRLYAMTPRYRDQTALWSDSRRFVELHANDDGLVMVGIPGSDTLARWQNRHKLIPQISH